MLRGKTMNIVAHNLTAINAQRQFGINLKSKTKSTEKLSSGYKISRAADDAAGLAISEKMRRQIRGLKQGVENTQDGVSLCQVADGALAEVNDMLHRITELSVQSANGTNSDQDRQSIQEEISQILKEIDRIGKTTTFNELKIFTGDEVQSSHLPITVGQLNVTGITTDSSAMTYHISADNSGFEINGDSFLWSSFTKGTDTLANVPISGGTYSFQYHGFTLSLDVNDNASREDLIGRLNGASFETEIRNPASGSKLSIYEYKVCYLPFTQELSAGDTLKVCAKEISRNNGTGTDNIMGTWFEVNGTMYKPNPSGGESDNINDINCSNNSTIGPMDTLITLVPPGNSIGASSRIGLRISEPCTMQELIDAFNNADVTFEKADTSVINNPGTYHWYKITNINLNVPTSSGNNQLNIKQILQSGYQGRIDSSSVNDTAYLKLWIQSGSEPDVGMYLTIDRMDTGILGISDLNVSTVDGANHAMEAVKGALQKVSANRAKIGAQQNRLEHTIANEENIVENTTAAESRIRDTDMAEEMVKYSKENILEQVGYAMMAQANQSNEGVLALLR